MRRVWLGAMTAGVAVAAWTMLGGEPSPPDAPRVAPPVAPGAAGPSADGPSSAGDGASSADAEPGNVAGEPGAVEGGDAADPVTEPSPEAPSASAGPRERALAELDEDFAAFVDLDLAADFDPELPREAQNDLLARALAAKAEAFAALQAAYGELARGGDDEVSALALVRLAEAHEEMAHAIETLPQPSYLNDVQAEVYRDGMLAKADATLEQGRAALAEAEAVSERAGVEAHVRQAIDEARETLGE